MITGAPFHYHGLTLIPACKSNYIHYKVWVEIIYPFPNFNGAAVEVWERINNFIPHFTGHICDYLSVLGLKLNHVIKGSHDDKYQCTSNSCTPKHTGMLNERRYKHILNTPSAQNTFINISR